MYSIFLADDEAWVVFGLKKRIEKSGLPFQVIGESNNGVTAFEEIMEKKPDVVITDIRMPGLDGLELIEKIRRENLDIEVIFISGYAEFEYAKKALQMGAVDFLVKPVGMEELRDVLMCIERKKAGQPEQKKVEPDIQQPMWKSVVKKIQTRYMENISLNDLAEEYNVSASYLSNGLKEKLGMPFSEYITLKRIQKSKELLADERLSIEQVAEKVGYHDYFYFTKVFKKMTGVTPSKYRKNMEWL